MDMMVTHSAFAERTQQSGSVAPCTGKILIATNDVIQRGSVSSFLASRGYPYVVAESSEDTLLRLRQGGIDLVVTAMQGSEADGFELMRLVREMMPNMPVIVLALGHDGMDDLQLDCATGLKSQVADGGEVLARMASLTARERQVLDLIVAGRANKVIAFELNISPRTVENHRARVMEKLRVKSVAELVRLALSAQDIEARNARKLAGANDIGNDTGNEAPGH
jgi:two-component system response regulator FixJ